MQITDHSSHQSAVLLASELAGRQFGAVSRRQLLAEGISTARIRSWLRSGRLHRRHPGVYAWGRADLGTEGELAAQLLLAGPDAALASLTALWWLNLLHRRPRPSLVASPHRCAPRRDVRVMYVPNLTRRFHRGLPVVPLCEALLAATAELACDSLRLVLARAEFERLLDRREIETVIGSGRPGTAALRAAVDSHLPALARCANGFERDFVLLCERCSVPIPEPNVRIGRYRPDMLWRGAMLIVELDGRGAHSTPAQLGADHRRQVELERRGFTVIRFTREQLTGDPAGVVAELRRRLDRTR
ncbi:MAG: DUF559 domain-containing protein [Thermoleophilia bacterium]|nr:DUF559 domain-containing protein [Thermoleophilia bacterium]GIK76627.1 MAG: hypothetical protein BroJett022_03170 [Actinomycetes bacterium]